MKNLLPTMAMTAVCLAGTLPASHAQSTDFLLGTAVAPAQAERSITIAADTRWANVKQGESIRFESGQQVFGWKFDGTRSAVDLMRVAPAGFVNRPIMVYVAPTANGRRGN